MQDKNKTPILLYIDAGSKVTAIIAAVFTVYLLSQEWVKEIDRRAEQKSLYLIDEYFSPDIRRARINLIDYLRETSGLNVSSERAPVYYKSYYRLLQYTLFSSQETRRSVFIMDDFFSRTALCVATEQCDRNILLRSLCVPAETFAKSYSRPLRDYASSIGAVATGSGAERFAALCRSSAVR